MFKNLFKKMAVAPKFDTTYLVSKWYEMNPETEDLLPNGSEIKNGMVLLVESHNRVDLNEINNEADYYDARVRNRWCVVSNVETSHDGLISFVATYDDGTKVKRMYGRAISWFVRDYMPTPVKMNDYGSKVKRTYGPAISWFVRDYMPTPVKINMNDYGELGGLKLR